MMVSAARTISAVSGIVIPIKGFAFLTCGIHFSLFLSDPMVSPYDQLCSVTAPRRPISIRNMEDKAIYAARRVSATSYVAENMRNV
jgi:hypothetical protein